MFVKSREHVEKKQKTFAQEGRSFFFCLDEFPVPVCNATIPGDERYWFVDPFEEMSWSNAVLYCQKLNRNLVSILCLEQNEVAGAQLSVHSISGAWIGLNRQLFFCSRRLKKKKETKEKQKKEVVNFSLKGRYGIFFFCFEIC